MWVWVAMACNAAFEIVPDAVKAIDVKLLHPCSIASSGEDSSCSNVLLLHLNVVILLQYSPTLKREA